MNETKIMPELTLELTPTPSAPTAPVVAEEKKAEPAEITLSPEEEKIVAEFLPKIDVRDSNLVLQYGAGSQQKIADFSENILNTVRTKDLGEIGNSLSELVVELKGFGAGEEKKGLLGVFKRAGNKLESLMSRFAEKKLDTILSIDGELVQGEEFMEFYPKNPTVEKWFLCTEELHRRMGGKWQDFSNKQ